MRYLVALVSVLLILMPVTVLSESTGESLTEAEVLQRMAGSWVEDQEATLEQIERRLAEEDLDRRTREQLSFARRAAQEALLEFHFSEDGSVWITNKGQEQEIERGRMEVLSVSGNQAKIALEGGQNFLNIEELIVGFDDDDYGFYLYLDDKIKRNYLPN